MATQTTTGTLYGIEKINIKVLNGTTYEVEESIWLEDIFEMPISMIIEQGNRVLDEADGVGIIAVHEEDDTLIGADISVEYSLLNIPLIYSILGGTLQLDQYDNITSYKFPTITQQRANQKIFQLDAYIQCNDMGDISGYLCHKFFYCRASVPSFGDNKDGNFSSQKITIKARPRPDNEDVHEVEFVDIIPI